VALAAPAVSTLALQAVRPAPHLLPRSAGLEALFSFYAAGSLIAYMLADRKATDVIPIHQVARALCSVEMLVGVIYLAAVVSRLIRLALQTHATTHGPD
jgi:hypothetical protein